MSSQRQLYKAVCVCRPTYTAVSILIEDLRRQWVAFLWLPFPGDVAVHPEPLLLHHGNIYFLEVDSIGLQETNHRLLVLLHLNTTKYE